MQPAETGVVSVPFPPDGGRHLRISVGACRLRIRPGDSEEWVSGTYQDPTRQVPLRITREGGGVHLTQGVEFRDPPAFLAGVPTIDLALGTRQPYELTIESGASDNIVDLGGLPLTRLSIRFGAGRTDVDFSRPNPQAMDLLDVSAGAGALNVSHLANANAADIRIEGGAAGFRLDFGGSLLRDTRARISTGLASVEIVVPDGVATRMTSESVLGSVDVGDGWMKKEGAFWNQAAVQGMTPVLEIHASVALGSLQLRTAS
jgi:hypothetical protein